MNVFSHYIIIIYILIMETLYIISINVILSVFAFFCTYNIIPHLKSMFIGANLYGKDLNKKSKNKM